MGLIFEGEVFRLLLALAFLVSVTLLVAIWLELRQLRRLLEVVLASNRDGSRSLMAAIHEGIVMLGHTIRSEANSTKSKTKSREGAS